MAISGKVPVHFLFQVVMPCRKSDEKIINHPFGDPAVFFALLPEQVKIWQFSIHGHDGIFDKDKTKSDKSPL